MEGKNVGEALKKVEEALPGNYTCEGESRDITPGDFKPLAVVQMDGAPGACIATRAFQHQEDGIHFFFTLYPYCLTLSSSPVSKSA